MRRFWHTDNLERVSTPKERLRFWAAAALELFGLGALGWTLGSTIVAALSDPGVLKAVLIGLASAMFARWIRWRRPGALLYGVGIAIIVLTTGAPLLRHFLP